MQGKFEGKNARIKSTMLGIEDHGIFTFNLNLEYGVGMQDAGGICLGNSKGCTPLVGDFLVRLLEVVGVDTWEHLPGMMIRVVANRNGVKMIGNALDDDWLDFKQWFEDKAREGQIVED